MSWGAAKYILTSVSRCFSCAIGVLMTPEFWNPETLEGDLGCGSESHNVAQHYLMERSALHIMIMEMNDWETEVVSWHGRERKSHTFTFANSHVCNHKPLGMRQILTRQCSVFSPEHPHGTWVLEYRKFQMGTGPQKMSRLRTKACSIFVHFLFTYHTPLIAEETLQSVYVCVYL